MRKPDMKQTERRASLVLRSAASTRSLGEGYRSTRTGEDCTKVARKRGKRSEPSDACACRLLYHNRVSTSRRSRQTYRTRGLRAETTGAAQAKVAVVVGVPAAIAAAAVAEERGVIVAGVVAAAARMRTTRLRTSAQSR